MRLAATRLAAVGLALAAAGPAPAAIGATTIRATTRLAAVGLAAGGSAGTRWPAGGGHRQAEYAQALLRLAYDDCQPVTAGRSQDGNGEAGGLAGVHHPDYGERAGVVAAGLSEAESRREAPGCDAQGRAVLGRAVLGKDVPGRAVLGGGAAGGCAADGYGYAGTEEPGGYPVGPGAQACQHRDGAGIAHAGDDDRARLIGLPGVTHDGGHGRVAALVTGAQACRRQPEHRGDQRDGEHRGNGEPGHRNALSRGVMCCMLPSVALLALS